MYGLRKYHNSNVHYSICVFFVQYSHPNSKIESPRLVQETWQWWLGKFPGLPMAGQLLCAENSQPPCACTVGGGGGTLCGGGGEGVGCVYLAAPPWRKALLTKIIFMWQKWRNRTDRYTVIQISYWSSVSIPDMGIKASMTFFWRILN